MLWPLWRGSVHRAWHLSEPAALHFVSARKCSPISALLWSNWQADFSSSFITLVASILLSQGRFLQSKWYCNSQSWRCKCDSGSRSGVFGPSFHKGIRDMSHSRRCCCHCHQHTDQKMAGVRWHHNLRPLRATANCTARWELMEQWEMNVRVPLELYYITLV